METFVPREFLCAPKWTPRYAKASVVYSSAHIRVHSAIHLSVIYLHTILNLLMSSYCSYRPRARLVQVIGPTSVLHISYLADVCQ
jgi:hypothetical protein